MIDLGHVDDVLRAHHEETGLRRQLWERMAKVADSRVWDVVGAPKQTPVKVTVNTLRPFLDRMVSQLYIRTPKHVVAPPRVRSLSKRGGRLTEEQAAGVAVALDEWVQRADVQLTEDAALRMALAFDGAAFRLGFDRERKDHALNQVWVVPVPPWEAGWDPLATDPETATYRFHLRWEKLEVAERMLGGEGEGKSDLCERLKAHARPMQDFLDEGQASTRQRPALHVLMLDWWSLCERGEEEILTVPCSWSDGRGAPSVLREFLTVEPDGRVAGSPLPYRLPDGRPLHLLIPIVLASSIGYPMRAVGVARTPFDESVEKSRLHSIVSSAVYRDLARQLAFDQGRANLSEETIQKLQNPLDNEIVDVQTVDGKPLNVAMGDLFKPISFGPLSDTLDKARYWLGVASAESSALSTVGQGKSEDLKYASATTIDALTRGDAAASSAIQERMRMVLGMVSSTALAIAGREARAGLSVLVDTDEVELPAPVLRAPWLVSVRDPSVAEAERLGRQGQTMQASDLLVKLAELASSPNPEVPAQVRMLAQRLHDVVVDVHRLPDTVRWSALQKRPTESAEDAKKMLEADAAKQAAAAAPSAPAAPAPAGPPPEGAPPVDASTDAILEGLRMLSPEQVRQLQLARKG